MSSLDKAKEKAFSLLKKLQTEKGFLASDSDIDNYKRIWSRDGIITGLSSLTLKDKGFEETFIKTLETLKDYQDYTGRIPSNVSLDGKKVSYGTTVGRVDATIWFVLGASKYASETNDADFWFKFEDSVRKAVVYLSCLELNGRGLLYIPPGGDWADEYLNEGYVLFDQCIYAIALNYFYQVSGDSLSFEKYQNLRKIIEINYIPKKENLNSEFIYHKALFENIANGGDRVLPVSSFTPFDIYEIQDLFAISLVFNLNLNFDLEKIQKEIDSTNPNGFPIIPAFSPVIDENHRNWSDLENNHLYRFKNRPYEFHNGGLWPLVHGIYLASKKELDKKDLEEFSKILNEFGFREFFHGKSFKPMGMENLGMSVAGFLFACDRLENNNLPFEI